MGTQKFNSNIDVNGEVKGTSLDINGNADISGALTVNLNGDALNLRSTTNGQPANITFSTNVPDDQVGHIKYSHSNSASYAGGESFTIGGTETTTVILADGQLMYKDGIYSKPASGTGAGTRKDANWDTAYGWGNHASGGYLSTSGKAADSEKLDGLDSQEYGKVTPVGTWKSFTDPLTDTSGFIDSSWVNKFEFFDTSNILVETSTDDSTYTTTTEYSDAQLKNLMGGDGNAGINIPNLGTTGTAYKRFTFTASNYVSLSMLYEYVTRVSGTLEMKLEKRQVNTWTTVKDYTNVGGWPAHVALRHGTIWFNSNTTSTGHHWQVRVTIKGTTTNSSYPNHIINKLQWWGGYPSGRRNLFSTDSTKNATFPADLTVTGALTLGTLLAPAEGGTGLSSISTLLNSNVTSVSGNAGTVTNGVYTNATQTITGVTTFSNTLTADIKIKDTRSSGDVSPANFPTSSASFSFTDDFGGLGNWYSGITMKGWSGNYAAWQLISEADSSAGDNNLYFRTGAASTWNSIRTVAMLDGTQTFSGAKTFTDTLALTGTGRITGIDTVSAGTDAANKTYVDTAETDAIASAATAAESYADGLASNYATSAQGTLAASAIQGGDSPSFDDLTVTGNLTITGDIDSYNTTTLDVTDKTISVSKGGTAALADGAGLIVDRGSSSDATILWDHSNSRFNISDDVVIAEGLEVGDSVVANGVTLTGDQTTVTGNAGTVTNGVYTTGDQTIAGNKTFSNNLTVNGTTILDSLQLEATGDYITFYGGNSTQHSITSRQLAGGTGDDLRFNTYGSYIINLDSNNNQSTAAASSFFITKHGGADGDASGNLLFDIDGENGDATFTGDIVVSGTVDGIDIATDVAANTAKTSNIVQTTVTGNAGTATKLAATKTIAGVAFDGSTNISLNNNAITNGAGYTTYAGPEDGVEGTKGIVEIATEEEAIAGEESVVKAITPYGVLASFSSRKVTELTAPTAAFAMNSQKITGLATPTASADAANKTYVDAKEWNWNDITAGTPPTFNQNTTGSAGTLTTTRAIYGNNFDGSAAVTGTIATAYIADDAITEDKLANTLLAEIDANTTKNTSPNIYGEYIKITLADFAMGGYTGNTKFGVAFDKTAGSTTYGVRVPDSAAELYTFVNIPQGYKATHVEIYGKRTKVVEAFEVQINASTAVSKGTGICNTEFAITNVSSTATNLLMIEVVVTSNAADRVYGGRVKIAVI